MMKRNLIKSLLAISSLIVISGCTTNNKNSGEDFNPVELLSCGSTSVEKVISKLGEKFASLTDNKVTFKKDQHGSGDATKGVTTGINNLKYDIGFLSREIKDSEKADLSDGNLNGVMCKDAVVPVVNENNAYSGTNAGILSKLYKGEIKSWSDVDSSLENKNIKLYSREAGSGTRECFFEGIGYSDVKAEDKWNDGVVVSSQASNGDMMSAIKDDKYGIGYCSLDSLSTATGIKGLSFEGVAASEETVIDGTYKLSRNFNYVIRCDYSENESNKKIAVNAFIDFMSTKEGLSTIKSVGGIISGLSSAPSWSSIQKEKYPTL